MLFLLTFFLIYGGTHVYFFLKARAAFSLGFPASFLLSLFLLAMFLAPVAVRLLERGGHEPAARLAAWIGYCWLGFLFLFFSSSLLLDLYRLVMRLGGALAGRDISPLLLSQRGAFLLPIAYAAIASGYGYFEALNIRTERVTIATPKLPAGVERLRVVQLSDVHLGLIVREERLGRIIAEVKRAEPDLLVSTGDLVDGQLANLSGLAELLREVRPRYGKFAVTGNHEFYAGLSQALDFTRRAGFTVLRGEGVAVAGVLNVAGVDDPAGRPAGLSLDIPESELLTRLPRDRFTLFLKHRPAPEKESLGLFDLQLSGHVHKGQIFPFILVTRFFYPVKTGLSSLSGASLLYVNRGAGTWGAPVRFLAPPEVTVIDLVRSVSPKK